MQRSLFLFLLMILFLNCKSQNLEFETYLSNFENIEIPIFVSDTQTYYVGIDNISRSSIRKFICQDSLNCDLSWEFEYSYGGKYQLEDFYVVLVYKYKDKGTTVEDFDLVELILLTYGKQGDMLSQQIVAKRNDVWMSSVQITKEKVTTQQVKLLELNQQEVKSEVQTIEYVIYPQGMIKETIRTPVKERIAVWDPQTERYKLKQD
jgi:hypothetical protein